MGELSKHTRRRLIVSLVLTGGLWLAGVASAVVVHSAGDRAAPTLWGSPRVPICRLKSLR